MKRYCLTKCAKQKLSKAKENAITVLSVALAILTVFAVGAGFLVLLGYIVEYLLCIGWFPAPNTPFKNIFYAGGYGIVWIMLTGLILYGSFHIIKWFYKLFKSIGTSVVHRMDPSYESCKLFEECKDEKDEYINTNYSGEYQGQ